MSKHTPRPPGEIGFTIVLMAGSAFLLWQAFAISGLESITSAGVFPMLAALTMLVTAAVALLQGLRRPAPVLDNGEGIATALSRRLTPPALLGFTATITAYMLLLEPLGFMVSSYLFLVGSMALLGSRRWWMNVLVSAAVLGAIVLVFQTVFAVVLPQGTWLNALKG